MKEKASKEIGSRIKELIFKLGLNQTSFAKSVGVSQNAIYNTINGVTKTPRYTLLESILKVYPQLNRDWLLEGQGEMFIETITPNSSPDNYLQEHLKNLEKQFAEMREMFSSQMATKDKQIEYYQRQTEQLLGLLGKPECVTETGVEREHPSTKELREEKVLATAA